MSRPLRHLVTSNRYGYLMESPSIGRKRRASRPRTKHTKTCLHCGSDLAGRAGRAYCSNACKQAAYRARKAAEREGQTIAALRAEAAALRREVRALEDARQYECARAEQAYAEREAALGLMRWADRRAEFWRRSADEAWADLADADIPAGFPAGFRLTDDEVARITAAQQSSPATLRYEQWAGFCHGVHVGALAARCSGSLPADELAHWAAVLDVTEAQVRQAVEAANRNG